MNLSEFQIDNGLHLEKVGFFKNKSVQDLIDHLTDEVREVQKAWNEEPDCLLYLDGEDRKPEGIAAELADVMLLVLDLAHFLGFDMAEVIDIKNDYNINRRPLKK